MKELLQSLMFGRNFAASTLHACWKSVWPNIFNGENSSVALKEEYSRVIELSQELGGEGFDDITQADIKELM